MAKLGSANFFDVLIDRLVEDVRRDFEAEQRSSEEPTDGPINNRQEGSKRVSTIASDDLVSKMIGFRSRLKSESQIAVSGRIAASDEGRGTGDGRSQAKFQTGEIRNQMLSDVEQRAQPTFASTEAQVAFQMVTRDGARFSISDLVPGGGTSAGGTSASLSRESLRRERRRVLLTLHPDRQPERDRAEAHNRFLAAAEAFSILAATAAEDTIQQTAV